MNDIKVGQVLYERTKRGIELRTVTKVGRKYFYVVVNNREYAVSLEDLVHMDKDYSPANFTLHLSIKDIQDKDKILELSQAIRAIIGQYGIITQPLPVLEQIYDLLTKQ